MSQDQEEEEIKIEASPGLMAYLRGYTFKRLRNSGISVCPISVLDRPSADQREPRSESDRDPSTKPAEGVAGSV